MLFRRLVILLPLAACQNREAAPEAAPKAIVVTEHGTQSAKIIPTIPCRATIESAELVVGTAPIVAQNGATRWTGDIAANGTTFSRDGERVARMWSANPTEIALIDPQGIAIIRAQPDVEVPGRLVVTDRQSGVVRYIAKTKDGVTAGDALVTGTDDLLLVAVLTATEASPEVRGLAACHRLFPIEPEVQKAQ